MDGVQCERVFTSGENVEEEIMRNRSILIWVNKDIVDECVEIIAYLFG